MKPVHTISDLAALRALSDPLRTRIIGALRGTPRTTAQIAVELGEGTTKLHYHVGELERNGLIELVETRQKGNLIEKYYRPVAEFFRVDPALFQEGPEALEAFYLNVASMLDVTALELRSAISKGVVTPEESGRSFRSLLRLRLREDEVAEFRSRLECLVTEYVSRSRPEGDRGLALTVLFVPLAIPAGADEGEIGGGPAPRE